ncbi:MAG: HD-GYP domain-containing protein [Candidatus Omnitrophica bacterium]|nr:HD-GYP domain-containing protein [Candidatus Omnitrophota bacterium]
MDGEVGHLFKKLIRSMELLKTENHTLSDNLKKTRFQLLRLLTKIVEEIDPHTKGHSIKVYRYVIKIAKRLQLSQRQISTIGNAALLHDVGKIAIDRNILNKKGKLTPQEFAVIRNHPTVGVDIISQIEYLKSSCPHVLYHHARFEGGGYPRHKFKGEEIPIGARIIAVADSYDAMTSDRPYRKAYAKECAIEELKLRSGRMYDPQIVDIFIEMLEEK